MKYTSSKHFFSTEGGSMTFYAIIHKINDIKPGVKLTGAVVILLKESCLFANDPKSNSIR